MGLFVIVRNESQVIEHQHWVIEGSEPLKMIADAESLEAEKQIMRDELLKEAGAYCFIERGGQISGMLIEDGKECNRPGYAMNTRKDRRNAGQTIDGVRYRAWHPKAVSQKKIDKAARDKEQAYLRSLSSQKIASEITRFLEVNMEKITSRGSQMYISQPVIFKIPMGSKQYYILRAIRNDALPESIDGLRAIGAHKLFSMIELADQQ